MLKTELGEVLHTGLTIPDAFERRCDAADTSQWTVIVERDSPSAEELQAYNRVVRPLSMGPMSFARPQIEYSAESLELSASTPIKSQLMLTDGLKEDESGNIVIPSTEGSERRSILTEPRPSAKAKRPRPSNSSVGFDQNTPAPAPKRLKPSALSNTVNIAEQSPLTIPAKNKVQARADIFDANNIYEDAPLQPALGSRLNTKAGKSSKAQPQPDLPSINRSSPHTALDDRVGVRSSVARSLSGKNHNTMDVDQNSGGQINGMERPSTLAHNATSNQDFRTEDAPDDLRPYSERISSMRSPDRHTSEAQGARLEKLRVDIEKLRTATNSGILGTPQRKKLTPHIPGSDVKPIRYAGSLRAGIATSQSPSPSPATNQEKPKKPATEKPSKSDVRNLKLIKKDQDQVRSLLAEGQAEDSEVHTDGSAVKAPTEKRKRGRPTLVEAAAKKEVAEKVKQKLRELGMSSPLASPPPHAPAPVANMTRDTTAPAPKARGRPVGSKNKPRTDAAESSKKKPAKEKGSEESDAGNDNSVLQQPKTRGRPKKPKPSDKLNDTIQDRAEQETNGDEVETDDITTNSKSTGKRTLKAGGKAAQPTKKVRTANGSAEAINSHAMDESKDRPAVLAVAEARHPNIIITKTKPGKQTDQQRGSIGARSYSRSPAKEVTMTSEDDASDSNSDTSTESMESLSNARNQSGQPKSINDDPSNVSRNDSDLEPKIPTANSALDTTTPRPVADTPIPVAKQALSTLKSKIPVIDLTASEDDEPRPLPKKPRQPPPSSNDQAEAQLLAESTASQQQQQEQPFIDLFPHPKVYRVKPRTPAHVPLIYASLARLKKEASENPQPAAAAPTSSHSVRVNQEFVRAINPPARKNDDDDDENWSIKSGFDANSTSSSSSSDNDDDDDEVQAGNNIPTTRSTTSVQPRKELGSKKSKRATTKKPKATSKKAAPKKKTIGKGTKKGFRGLLSWK